MNKQAIISMGNSLPISVRYALPIFTFTLFFSAFLLFSVQPFFAKMVLPKLGGSPAVWSVAMVFFQSALLAGYGYAHLLITKFSTRTGALIHFTVMAVALVFLPIAISSNFTTPPESGQMVWLFMLFTASIGLPFFAVSANGPLLQAWFSRTGHPHANDPYFLYGASNIGSFASLFLYIILIEPQFSLGDQSMLWTIGFLILAVCIAFCAIGTIRQSSVSLAQDVEPQDLVASTSLQTKLKWVLYAAIPSGLLIASTAHISSDIASIPFLWVAPLALFLLTFVFAFARKPLFSIALLSRLLGVLTGGFFIMIVIGLTLQIYVQIALNLFYFFVAALLAHSLLVSLRPQSKELTSFYLWMSFGGVLGGIFTSILAPLLFNWVAEYALLAVAAYLIRPTIWQGNRKETLIVLAVGLVLAIAINSPLRTVFNDTYFENGRLLTALFVFGIATMLLQFRREPLAALCIIVACGVTFLTKHGDGGLYNDRSFFGVISAKHSQDGRFIEMAHGTTIHGSIHANQTGRPEPLTYYHRLGGIADSLFAVQQAHQGKPINVGIVGLGIGSMLCHRQANENWTLFEIDTAVIKLAERKDIFRFMSECGADNDEMVVGDARLSLVDQADGKFDYLLIDAFSSDSIPVHLLTVQAMELFRQKLNEDGLLVVHISNRHLELESVVAANANQLGMHARIRNFKATEEQQTNMIAASTVVSLSNTELGLGKLLELDNWVPLDPKTTTAWTDDYSNVLAAILRHKKSADDSVSAE